MNKKHVAFSSFRLVMLSICAFFLGALPVYAEAVPGGNIANPVVRAVDLAKPAIVRIITTQSGRLTVQFPSNKIASFPQNGGSYPVQLSGSGAFISAHGDILTADHVIRPPHDASLDQLIEQEAAPDVANYINQNFTSQVPWGSDDALKALNSGYLLSQPRYDAPTSKVYLSTDYTGPLQATDMNTLPSSVAVDVDRVEAESSADQKDVAIIHVNMEDTPSIPLDDSTNVAQQDELTIIGFPGNGDVSSQPTAQLTSSVNKAYVSALKTSDAGSPLIQVGGNIEHGDSGGPALDSSGNIVGIVSFDQNSSMPEGTGFLQSSNSASDLINRLGLDLKPGNCQQQWNQAFSDYTSTALGHWHKAQADFQGLAASYPQFQAIDPFLSYSQDKAKNEKMPQKPQSPAPSEPFQIKSGLLIGIAAICLALLILIAVLLTSIMRRKHQQKQKSQPVQHNPLSPTVPWQWELSSMAARTVPDVPYPPATPWPSAQAASFESCPAQPIIVSAAAPWPPIPNNTPDPQQVGSSAQPDLSAARTIKSNPIVDELTLDDTQSSRAIKIVKKTKKAATDDVTN